MAALHVLTMQAKILVVLIIPILLTSSTSAAIYELDFEYTNSNGEITSLSTLSGKYLVLDAMATWCAPCRIEMLHLQDVQSVIESDSNVDILTMSMDPSTDSIAKIRDFMGEFDAGWEFGLDHEVLLRDHLNVTGYPTTFIISPEGEILKTWLGLTDADTIIKELDLYLDLPGALIRSLGIDNLFNVLLNSPFFAIFLIMLWIVIFRVGYITIKKISVSETV